MHHLSLHGNWILKRTSTGDLYSIAIPNDVISALYEQQVIEDPYLGKNELDIQWVGTEEWEIEKTISLNEQFLDSNHITLDIETIDTVARIYCNEREAGYCDNMFLRYSFDVTKLLHVGRNTIKIHLYSNEKIAYERNATLPYPIEHMRYPVQSMHRNLVRKAQCHSGWDWGPCLMTSGVYGEISLNSTKVERIVEVQTLLQKLKDDSWSIGLTILIYSSYASSSSLSIELGYIKEIIPLILKKGNNSIHHTLIVKNVDLWWPNGYGEQPLYTLKVSSVNDKKEKKIGFRTIEVDTTPDIYGIGMTFIVNGIPIFAKGANWIVMDALPGRYTTERYEDLLTSCIKANMNMLRVWGGGQYETETFYNLCDQLGILVWQDFMFACSLYPATPWFLNSVKQEVLYQIMRLKDHPSIALWCGNNEDIGALTWFESSRKNRDRYLIDYDHLNEGIIGKTVKELDPTRKWWSSSPSAGESDYSDCWHDDSKGDMHYWSVWHEGKPFESYKEIIPRFCSEFGFQSFPSLSLLKDVITCNGTKEIDSADFNISSSIMEHHQRNDRGNTIILSTMIRYFHLPSTFDYQIYVSQIQQAFAMKTAIEYWRSNRPRCMGTLYWQLQDNWPVASWSSIEYGGKWKALQYIAKKFYQPLHITFVEEQKVIIIKGINDRISPIEGLLTIERVYYNGKRIRIDSSNVTIDKESATKLYILPSLGDSNREDYLLYASFKSTDGEEIENHFFPTYFKAMNLQKPTITVKLDEEDPISSMRLSSDVVSLYVSIDHPKKRIQLSDNFFHLIPYQEKIIEFECGPISAQEAKELIITNLRETY